MMTLRAYPNWKNRPLNIGRHFGATHSMKAE